MSAANEKRMRVFSTASPGLITDKPILIYCIYFFGHATQTSQVYLINGNKSTGERKLQAIFRKNYNQVLRYKYSVFFDKGLFYAGVAFFARISVMYKEVGG